MIVKTRCGTQSRSLSNSPAEIFLRISVEDKLMRGSGIGTMRASPRSGAGTAGSVSASRHMTPNFTFRQRRSASRHLSRAESWSAPKIQKNSARGNASSKCSTVRMDQLFPPCSISQVEISAFGISRTALSSIARRSFSGAPGAAFFSGDCAAGTKIRRSSFSVFCAAFANARCALCTGSKLPPKSPMRGRRKSGSLCAGTGSGPPADIGLQRKIRHAAKSVPVKNPCRISACRAYSEQVGEKRQNPFPPNTACSAGEMIFR